MHLANQSPAGKAVTWQFTPVLAIGRPPCLPQETMKGMARIIGESNWENRGVEADNLKAVRTNRFLEVPICLQRKSTVRTGAGGVEGRVM